MSPRSPRAAENPTTTVRDALAQFVEEYTAGKSERKRREVLGVMDLLTASIDGYAYQDLEEAEAARWKAAYDAEGPAHREFSEIFGAEKIAPNVREFLTYFLPRKVMAGDSFLRAAASTTRALVTWLEAKGWAESDLAADLTDDARAAARDLPRAQKLARNLRRWVEDNIEPADDAEEDRFEVTRILGDRIWLRGSGIRAIGPIRLPEAFVRELALGWTISGAVAKRGRSWQFVDVWGVGTP